MAEKKKHVTVVPAQPGFSVVESCGGPNGEKDVSLAYSPVIAWHVIAEYDDETGQSYSWSIPIGIESGPPDEYAIKTPAGEFVFPESCTVQDEEGALKEFRDARARRAKGRVGTPGLAVVPDSK